MGVSGKSALLRVADMAEADRLAVAGEIPGIELMEAAGLGVARAVQNKFTSVPTAVFGGFGRNGGDGFIAARVLRWAGWTVRLGLLGSLDNLRCDTASTG